MKRRGLIMDGYDTAAHGFTMTELKLSTPEIAKEFVNVDGMHGALDYCEANGAPIYKTRALKASFELSEGSFTDRESTITELIRAVHGRKCDIAHPDHPGMLLSGRVEVSKNLSNLAHAKVSISATCQPWFSEEVKTFVELPILDRSHNLITLENTTFVAEYSTCEGSVTGDTEVVTVGLITNPAEINKCAVFRISLEANSTYYVSGRMLSKGFWRVSNAPTMPDIFSPVVATGADGFLYFFVVRLQSYSYVDLLDLVCVRSGEASIIRNGSFPVKLELQKPEGYGVLVSVGGVSKMHYSSSAPEIFAPPGDVPALAFRHATSDDEAWETVRYVRRWLA